MVGMLGIALYCTAVSAWRESDMEIKMNNLTKSQLGRLADLHLRGDVWPEENGAGATFYVTPGKLTQLDRAAIGYTVTIPDMRSYYKDFWTKQENFHHASGQSYHSADQIIALMDSLAQAFPAICLKISLGVSVQNRQLCMLKISKNATQHENEAQVCLTPAFTAMK